MVRKIIMYAFALAAAMTVFASQAAAADTAEEITAVFSDEKMISEEEVVPEQEETENETAETGIAAQGVITDDISYVWDEASGVLTFTGSGDARFDLNGDEVLGDGSTRLRKL